MIKCCSEAENWKRRSVVTTEIKEKMRNFATQTPSKCLRLFDKRNFRLNSHIRSRLFLMHTNVLMILNWRTKSSCGVRKTEDYTQRGDEMMEEKLLFKARVVWLSKSFLFAIFRETLQLLSIPKSQISSSALCLVLRSCESKIFKIKCVSSSLMGFTSVASCWNGVI